MNDELRNGAVYCNGVRRTRYNRAPAGNHSLTNKGKIVTYDVHSHNQNTPSDFKVSRTDYSRALNLHKKNPNVRVMLYMSMKENPRARMLNILANKWVKDY